MNSDDKQVGGNHYASPYQHWNYVADCGLGYFEAMAIKYIERHKIKNGLQDVQKAEHFVEKLIELSRNGYPPHNRNFTNPKLNQYLRAHPGLDRYQHLVIGDISSWTRSEDLERALGVIKSIKAQYATADIHASEPQPKGYVDQDQTPVLSQEQQAAVDEQAGLFANDLGGLKGIQP